MHLSNRTLSARLAAFSGAALLAVLLADAPRPVTVAAADALPTDLVKDVLDRVPSEAGFFAHGRASDLWNTALLKDIRKAVGKDGDKALADFESEMGISADSVDSVTFYYPQMPAGPGDEKTFVVAVITKRPYDKAKVLSYLRDKEAKEKDHTVAIEGDFVLHFTNARTFAVMHKSLVEKYAKGAIKDRKPGAVSDALKLATEKHTFVAALNLPTLPNEIFTAAPPELQPFLPLFKAKSATVIADLDKKFTLEARFACENANAATDAERSMNLLMKLAQDGLTGILNDKNTLKEINPVLPLLKEVEKGVKGIKVTKTDTEMKAVVSINVDLPIAEMVKSTVDKVQEAARRAQGQNNLKQIALAMHGYHDANNGFPPAAICDKKGKPLLSWRVALLPYIEQQGLYNQFKLDEPWDSENNIKLAKTLVKVYMVPGVTKPGETNYRIFHSNGAVFDPIQQTRIQDITDGTSNTIMVVEAAEGVPWTKPEDFTFDKEKEVKKLLLWQNDKTTIALCDGSVRTVGKKMAESTWKLLIQKADGNVIPADFE